MLAPRPASPVEKLYASYLAGDLSGTILEVESLSSQGLEATVLKANCYRQLGQIDLYRKLMDELRQLPESTEAFELSQALYQIQRGQLEGAPLAMVETLLQAGAQAVDAYSAVVQALFVRDQLVAARDLIDVWLQREPIQPQPFYLAAVSLNIEGKSQEAEAKFLENVARFPRHELSWLALVDLYSRPPQVRFPQAHAVLTRFVKLFPNNREGRLRLSRVERRLGLADQIDLRRLQELDQPLEVAKAASEQGQIDLAVKQLDSIGLRSLADFRLAIDRAFQMALRNESDAALELNQRLHWAATLLSRHGDPLLAGSIFELANDRAARLRRIQDLDAQMAVNNDPTLREQRQAMTTPAETPLDTLGLPLFELSVATEGTSLSAGFALYRNHCANCHGLRGDAVGRASSNLFPPPRNFRREPMRIVSAGNRLATDDDLRRTIRLGFPSSSMPGFPNLSEAEVIQLIDVLRWLMSAGVAQQYDELFGGQNLGSEHRRAWMEPRIQPSLPLTIVGPSISDTQPLGQSLLDELGCRHCHATGSQESTSSLAHFDLLGRQVRAPNLFTDVFKGGAAYQDIAKRIVLGIPGTPHPAAEQLAESDVQALATYILSQRTSGAKPLTNHQRLLSLPRLAP